MGDYSTGEGTSGESERAKEDRGFVARLLSHFPKLEAAGAPRLPLLELALVFAAFYLGSLVPTDPAGIGSAMRKPLFHVLLILETLPKALFLLYLVAVSDGIAAFGIRPPVLADAWKGAFNAIGAVLCVIPLSLALGAAGLVNPLLSAVRGGLGASPFMLPLILLSCLSIGYSEELFFRVYLMRRARQAGLPSKSAIPLSASVFAAAHGLQGLIGLLLAAVLGAYFAWRWEKSGNPHEIALGHGLYDFLVMSATLYS